MRSEFVALGYWRQGEVDARAFTPVPGGTPARAFARERLPEHLVPSVRVELSALPRAGTARRDRVRLPAPGTQRPRVADPAVAPRSPIEQEVARIWAETLGLDEVGVHDRFVNLGGHSLSAAALVSRVATAFGVEVDTVALFEASSVAAMAGIIAEHLVRALPPGEREGLFAASEAARARRVATEAPGQTAAAADAPAPAQWSHIRAARATDSSTSSSSM